MEKYEIKDNGAKAAKNIKLILAGLVIGFLNGFFGGGGGMLLVPALAAVLKTSVKQSHATAIAVILPLSVVSAAVYIIKGIEFTSAFLSVTGGVVLGGIIGALLLKKLSGKTLSVIFYLVMVAAGLKMIIS